MWYTWLVFDISLEHLGTLFGGPPKKMALCSFPILPGAFWKGRRKERGDLMGGGMCHRRPREIKGEMFVQVEILSFLRVGGENANL